MDYEQEYKKAIERAKEELQICGRDEARQIIRIFPELKEYKLVSAFVDLGLPSGTLWADHNLGADSPEQCGDYFRFGETVPYTEDSPEYVYEKFKKDIAGTRKDAATVILGKGFRTPTFEQIKELVDSCEQEWTTINGVKGIRVTGPNGNSIFFPAAGYRGYSLGYVGSFGYYWSATPYKTYNGRSLYFRSGDWDWDDDVRDTGLPIRPVKLKEK